MSHSGAAWTAEDQMLRTESSAVCCLSLRSLRDSCLRATLRTAAIWSHLIHINLSAVNLFLLFVVYTIAHERQRSGRSDLSPVLLCLFNERRRGIRTDVLLWLFYYYLYRHANYFPKPSQINIWVVCFFVIHIQQSFSSPWGIVAENISLKSGFKS